MPTRMTLRPSRARRTAFAIGFTPPASFSDVTNRSSSWLIEEPGRNLSSYRILDNGREERQPIGCGPIREGEMPTLLRFLTIIGLIAGLFYGTMFVLANFFEPSPHEMTKSIRDAKIK